MVKHPGDPSRVETPADAPPVPGWRVAPLEVASPQTLLQGGVALLEGLAEDPAPTLRWYRSDRPALVLGRGQATAGIQQIAGIPVLTRFSGGGAVLLDESLLSLDVLVPSGHPLLDGDLGAVFLRVGQLWVEGLRALGVQGLERYPGPGTARRRGTPREQLLAAVCFATVGRGEVLAEGRKLVGLAQRRRRYGALVQCGLLRRWEPSRLLKAFGADPADIDVGCAAVGLDELMTEPVDDLRVMEAVSRAFGGYGAHDGCRGTDRRKQPRPGELAPRRQ